ncbi:hypothetical protein V8F06_001015 [Rhypophila decipiens]
MEIHMRHRSALSGWPIFLTALHRFAGALEIYECGYRVGEQASSPRSNIKPLSFNVLRREDRPDSATWGYIRSICTYLVISTPGLDRPRTVERHRSPGTLEGCYRTGIGRLFDETGHQNTPVQSLQEV